MNNKIIFTTDEIYINEKHIYLEINLNLFLI